MAATFAIPTVDIVADEKEDSPTVTFKKGDVVKPLTKCPGGKIKIEITDGVAQLSNAETNKQIGEKLAHDKAKANVTKSNITCWAFSPDGKLVATGSSCDNRDASEGQICVWDVATGKRVTDYCGPKLKDEQNLRDPNRLGNILGLAFSEDGKTLLFKHKGFLIDGP